MPGFQSTLSRTYSALESGAEKDAVIVATITAVVEDRFLFSLGDRRGAFLLQDDGQVFIEPEDKPLWDTFIEEIRDMRAASGTES